jgi:hypothetical protein
MSTKIKVRSPFYKKVSNASLSYAVLKLYVYEGILTTNKPASPQYTITKKEVSDNNYVVFEVSELIRDFIGEAPSNEPIWAEVDVEMFDSSDASLGSDNSDYLAFNGFGYFEDGVNPLITEGLLQSNSTFYKQEGVTAKIPFSLEDTTEICFLGGSTEATEEIWNTDEDTWNTADEYWSENVISCVTLSSSDDSNNKIYYATVPALTEDIVVSTTSETVNITVKSSCEPKYTPNVVSFINKFGATQEITFFKKSVITTNVKSENFKSNTMDLSSLSYNISSAQYSSFNTQAKESISMNTGFVNEEYSDVIRQLMLSENVWVVMNGQTLPITPKTKSAIYKTIVNDKLINHTIEFDFAYDKINDIR